MNLWLYVGAFVGSAVLSAVLVGAVLGAVGVTAGGAVATYSLVTGPEYAEVLAVQPVKEKTGGSTFKNPEGHKAWQLVDEAGCRGFAIGGAQVSEKHTNFLINAGEATSADIEALGEEVRRRVKDKSGIELQWEIQRVGVAK